MIGTCRNIPLPKFDDCCNGSLKSFQVITRKIHKRLPRKIKKDKLNGFAKMYLTDTNKIIYAKLVKIY